MNENNETTTTTAKRKGGTKRAERTGGFLFKMTDRRIAALSELMAREGIDNLNEALDLAFRIAINVTDTNAPKSDYKFAKMWEYRAGGRLAKRMYEQSDENADADSIGDTTIDAAIADRDTYMETVLANETSLTGYSDAIDFALNAYTVLRRSGTVSDNEAQLLKQDVELHSAERKIIAKAFREQNMRLAQMQAQMHKNDDEAKKSKKEKGPAIKTDTTAELTNMLMNLEHTTPDSECKACKAIEFIANATRNSHKIGTVEVKYFDKNGKEVKNNGRASESDSLPF